MVASAKKMDTFASKPFHYIITIIHFWRCDATHTKVWMRIGTLRRASHIRANGPRHFVSQSSWCPSSLVLSSCIMWGKRHTHHLQNLCNHQDNKYGHKGGVCWVCGVKPISKDQLFLIGHHLCQLKVFGETFEILMSSYWWTLCDEGAPFQWM